MMGDTNNMPKYSSGDTSYPAYNYAPEKSGEWKADTPTLSTDPAYQSGA